MIINSTVPEGKSYNNISNNGNDFYYCVYFDNLVIKDKSPENSPTSGNTASVSTINNVFGADTFEELESEITRLSLTEIIE